MQYFAEYTRSVTGREISFPKFVQVARGSYEVVALWLHRQKQKIYRLMTRSLIL